MRSIFFQKSAVEISKVRSAILKRCVVEVSRSAHQYQAWRGRERQTRGHHSPSSIQGEWLAIDGQKNNILASLCLAGYLAANWLQKLEIKHCLLHRSYFCSYVCVCVCVCACLVSQFDLFVTKQNYLFVRCQFLSHIPNTSLRCSNQPLWKSNLMTEVNTKKQQMGEIKNTT